MKSQVNFQRINLPGIVLKVEDWFGCPVSEPDVIENFMHLCAATWELVAPDDTLVMSLIGDNMLLYVMCENRNALQKWIMKFEEYSRDYNREAGSERNN